MPKSFFVRVLLMPALLALTGCPSSPEPVPAMPAAPRQVELQILVVDDEPLAQAVKKYFTLRNEPSNVSVQTTTARELTAGARPAVDLLLYPAGLLGELAERNWFLEVPPELLDRPDVAFRELARPVRHAEIKWGAETLALPFGSPLPLVYYRSDIFESLGLKPPATWAEYQQQAARLSRREELGRFAPPADAPWYGAIEPLAPGWAGHLLLARAAPYVQEHGELSTLFQQGQLKPLLDQPPYVRALEEQAAAARLGPADHEQLTPSAVRARFLQGEAALAITWPTRDDAGFTPRPDLAFSFAELPGSRDYFRFSDHRWQTRRPEEAGRVPYLAFTGRLGSVVRGSRAAVEAFHLLLFLTGGEAQRELAVSVPTLFPTRVSQLAATDRWLTGLERQAARPFAAAWQSSSERASWLLSPRLPGRQEYLSTLDDAVAKTLGSPPVSAADSLAEAAQKWEAITTARGRDEQHKAYVRSHGLEP